MIKNLPNHHNNPIMCVSFMVYNLVLDFNVLLLALFLSTFLYLLRNCIYYRGLKNWSFVFAQSDHFLCSKYYIATFDKPEILYSTILRPSPQTYYHTVMLL